MATEVATDALGKEWMGCVVPITKRTENDKRFYDEARLLDPVQSAPVIVKKQK